MPSITSLLSQKDARQASALGGKILAYEMPDKPHKSATRHWQRMLARYGKKIEAQLDVDPSLLGGDVEMLEDLVTAAVAEVQKRAADIAQEEVKKLQSALPFPLPFSL